MQLEIVAREQRGVLIAYAGGVTFSSSNSAIAEVSASGVVIGVAAGTADISRNEDHPRVLPKAQE